MTTRVLKLPHGVNVSVEQPYTEGHVLSAIEAEKLNHVLADNIRTSIIAKLKRLAEAGEIDAASASEEFQHYADSYSFVVRSPKASADPIAKEANKIAKEQVFAAIRRKGGNPSDYSAEQIAEYVAKVISHKPEIMEEATRRVNSSRQLAGELLDDLLDEAA
jgi:hypothetical protein